MGLHILACAVAAFLYRWRKTPHLPLQTQLRYGGNCPTPLPCYILTSTYRCSFKSLPFLPLDSCRYSHLPLNPWQPATAQSTDFTHLPRSSKAVYLRAPVD